MAQFFSFGGSVYMRFMLTLLLTSLFLCSCMPKQNSAFEQLPVGRDFCCGTYVLHIDKRDGSSVSGVRVVSGEPNGQPITVTASRGSLSQGTNFPDVVTITTQNGSISRVTNCYPVVRMVLYDAHWQKGKQKALFREMPFDIITRF